MAPDRRHYSWFVAFLLFGVAVAPARADEADLTRQALAILQMRCAKCHGTEFAVPELDVLDRKSLVAERGKDRPPYIAPGSSQGSKLWHQVVAGLMPLGEDGTPQKLSDEELGVLRQWIDGGAPFPTADAESRQFITNLEVYEAILSDLQKLEQADRPLTRYFSLVHLHNNRNVSDADLRLHRAALSKAINSLSRRNTIVPPRPIDAEGTIYAVDLRVYGWTLADWATAIVDYPYGLRPIDRTEARVFRDVEDIYGVNFDGFMHVRSDWFVVTALRPPKYHALLAIPETLAQLDTKLGVNRAGDFQNDQLVRAGMQISQVSSQNRIIDYHPAKTGGYWISYDFNKNSGRGNLVRFPLGPVFDGNQFKDQAFEHAGGEIIFSLPNGLHGYMLVDGDGKRIDSGPIEIVADLRRTSGTPQIVNGLSCIACHAQGLRDDFEDVVAEGHALLNPGAQDKVASLYDNAKMRSYLADGREDYLRALTRATGVFLRVDEDAVRAIERFPEPVSKASRVYDQDLDLADVAWELGISDPEYLKVQLDNTSLQSLGLSPLKQRKTIKRSMWSALDGRVSPYQNVAQVLRIGISVTPVEQKP